MSNKSGVSEQVISLPKGGGALRGISETFAADLHTGIGNLTVPIVLPPGRNGFQPQLNLAYSTANPNGPFGLGWSLGVPGISRKTSDGVPRYRDQSSNPEDWDTFILSGAEDLVPVPGGAPGTARYRPRTEGLFARIEHHRDASPTPDPAKDHWEVRSKDGLVSTYGGRDADGELAAVADPDPARRATRIFAWKLVCTVDPFGNRIEYLYERDTVREEQAPSYHRWDQLYLSEIRYVDYGDDPDDSQFLVKVKFRYHPLPGGSDQGAPGTFASPHRRPDPFSDYRAGFEIRTVRRCTRIEVFTCSGGAETPVRTYWFAYVDPPPTNCVSLLEEIRVVGHDGTKSEALPPLTFGYSAFQPETRRDFFPVTGPNMPPGSLAHPDCELADLSGDGLPDILEMNGVVRYWRNLGGGQFDRPRMMQEAPAGVRLGDPGVQLLDADGDARIDLLIGGDGRFSGYYPLRFDGEWDRRSFRPYRVAPSFNLEDPEVRLVDLTGDGRVDIIRSGARLECFFNDPENGWTFQNTRWVDRGPLEDFPNVIFSDEHVRWADMVGDGLQDIVLVSNRKVEYWPALGHGDWGKRVTMRDSPQFPHGYNPRRVLLGDVNGDGLADLLYVEDTKVTLWINQGGNGWSTPITITGTPSVSDIDAVRLVDLLGSGISGVLWSAEPTTTWREHIFFLDFTGGGKPYLLNEMDNQMGAVTRVEYAPSTRFFLEDQQCLAIRWKTPLPFPVQVVASVEVIDVFSRGKLTTEYRYHHGYWDGEEREFRGFGLVEQLDTQTFEDYNETGLHGTTTDFIRVPESRFSPATLTKTWFHQGPIGDESRGWGESDFGQDFWLEDPTWFPRPTATTTFLQGLEPRVRRDALRTLRGRVLRTELYALDSTPRQDRPYTVTEYLYAVAPLPVDGPAPPQPAPWQQQVFFPHTRAERVTQWERGDDPLTQVTFTDGYDAYGQPRLQTIVALPRRAGWRRPVTGAVIGAVDVDEKQILATHVRTVYAVPDPGLDRELRDRVAQGRTFELANPGGVVEGDTAGLAQVLAAQVAAAQAIHDRFRQLLDPWQEGQPLLPEVRLIGHVLHHYDGPAFVGRPAGTTALTSSVGPYGALTRTEALAFSAAMLDAAYGNRRPAYLDGAATLPAGAPADVGSTLGYRLETPSPAGYSTGYYADIQRQQFDFQDMSPTTNPAQRRRGVVTAIQDALRHQTTIMHDSCWLLPAQVTDAVGLTTQAEYDGRTLQLGKLTDPNGHVTSYRYTPLGLLGQVIVQGNNGEGGTGAKPEIEFMYDFTVYDRTRLLPNPQPAFVHTRRRVWHASDNASDEAMETREYSDGFGRLIQTRTQAEELAFDSSTDDLGLPAPAGSAPAPAKAERTSDRVLVSGWRAYDNKGQVVDRYEPFFATGWAYQVEAQAKQGSPNNFFYDPRGRLIRIVSADGSELRIVLGSPADPLDLKTPDMFRPTPWERYTYDPNDLAPHFQVPDGISGLLASAVPSAHHHTPANAVLDALGRTIGQVVRNGTVPGQDWYVTRLAYDGRGNLCRVTDALGRLRLRQTYDLLDRCLELESLDAGLRTEVLDAVGNPTEQRDSKGSVILRQHDPLNRLTHVWARDTASSPVASTPRVTLRERRIYGDDEGDRSAARAAYLLNRLHQHYDEAGLLRFEQYDFKGNISVKTRRVVSNTALAGGWIADWSAAGSENALDPTVYEVTTRYDALNRPVEVDYPADVSGDRARLTLRYGRGGRLERLELGTVAYVRRIAYNAKGQRVLIAYGNGLMTRYAHDRRTFRLVRLRTESTAVTDTGTTVTWTGTGTPIQDFTYTYDLVGNITVIEDRTAGCGVVTSPDRLVRTFTYDPTYRLMRTEGRACADIGVPRLIEDLARCGTYGNPYSAAAPVPNQANAPHLTEGYTETYTYDPADNLVALTYSAASGPWTRTFGFAGLPPGAWQGISTNRLTAMAQTGQAAVHQYRYDDSGNLIEHNTERHYTWDHADRLIAFENRPAGATNASVEARYLSDAAGVRVKKWVRTNGAGAGESSISIDGFFEHCPDSSSGPLNYLHVMDDTQRVALIRRGPPHPKDAWPPIQYHLGDHLGTSGVVVDDTGAWVNREEFFPYGETSFGSFARKRYRFTSKERDEETGLAYHRARYYAPWLARWVSCDPAELADGINSYRYAHNNPMIFVDSTGKAAEPQISHANYEVTFDPVTIEGQRGPLALIRTAVAAERYADDPQTKVEFNQIWRSLLSQRMQESMRFGTIALAVAIAAPPLIAAGIHYTPMVLYGGFHLFRAGIGMAIGAVATRFQSLASNLASTIGRWQPASFGTRVMQVGDLWIKRVNPNVSALSQWWGNKAIQAQAEALTKLRDLAPRFWADKGVIITRNVGPTLQNAALGNLDKLRLWLTTYAEGSRRMGTFLNDILPRNMGANGLVFDPALDPLTQWLSRIAIAGGLATGASLIYLEFQSTPSEGVSNPR